MMNSLMQDLRYSLRVLAKQPLFAGLIVVTLALGIGANSAIYSLLDQILLRRLPVPHPEELVVLRSPGIKSGSISSDGDPSNSFSYPMYKALRDRNEVFAGLLARYGIPLSVSANGQTERAKGELVSGNYFQTLEVGSALGRLFTLEDDQQAGAHRLAVLSYGYWGRRFGYDPAILNKPILVNGQSLIVVGVARAGFNGVQVGYLPDIFIPITMRAQMMPNSQGLEDWNTYWLAMIGRVKRGMSTAQAQAAVQGTYRALLTEQVATNKDFSAEQRERFVTKTLELKAGERGRPQLDDQAGKPLLVLGGMVLMVLLIACTNVANLLLVRGMGRQRELAVRAAIGASRWQLMQQLLVESLLLALTGGVLGLLLATWLSDWLIRMVSANANIEGLTSKVDGRILLFTFALSVASGLFFGLFPAWRASRIELTSALKDQSSNSSASQSQSHLRKVLVAAQVALTVLLLTGAGLLTRTLMNLQNVNLGMQTQQRLAFSVAPELNGYSAERTALLYEQLRESLQNASGVVSVGIAEVPLLTGSNSSRNITAEAAGGNPAIEGDVQLNWVSPGYFSALGIPLVNGREFGVNDKLKSQKAAIINEKAAQKFFPNRNPIGARVAFGAGDVKFDVEIVGVVKNSNHSQVRADIEPFLYSPILQDDTLGSASFYVQARGDAAQLSSTVRSAVRALDADLPIYDLKTMEAVVSENLFAERLLASFSLGFGLLATLLAGLGLYGVLAYWVVQRRREIGIRIALGALPATIRGMVIKQGLSVTLIGAAVGLAAAYALSRALNAFLFGVKTTDPVTFIGVALLLALVALLACWLPARRAAQTDPMIALRSE